MFPTFNKIFNNFLTSGLPAQDYNLDNLRLRFINVFSLVGMLTLILFGVSYLFSQNFIPALIEISLGLVAGLNLLGLRFRRDVNFASSIVLLILISALIFLLINGGVDRTGIYWFFIFPVVSFFLKNKTESFAWLGLLVIILLTISVLNFGGFPIAYNFAEIRQLFISLAIESTLIFLFQSITESFERQVESKSSELLSTNNLLVKEVEDRKNAENQTLALLGESKKLQEMLRQEKLSVEEKVNERTKQLVEEQAKMQASINSLNMGFIMTDTNFKIVSINSTAKRILCVRKYNQALRGTGDLAIECKLEDIEEELKGTLDLREYIKRCFVEKNIININEVNFDNRVLHFFLSPIALYRQKLDIIGVVILVEDITEEKILDRSKAEFFSIASHELRTPLTAIRGNTALMKDYFYKEIKNKDLKKMIDDIHESSIRLIQIVNDFLDTSRLEQGRIEFNTEEFDLPTLVDEVFQEFKPTLEATKVKLQLEPAAAPIPLVIADRNRVKQIIINLIGNALKFTEKGSVTVNLEPKNLTVKISVTDTGKGISAANKKLLFHKFQQASDDILTRDSTRGTGLGLYISKLLVEGMGGRIQLESSEENKGSTFAFTLPAANKGQALPLVEPVPKLISANAKEKSKLTKVKVAKN